MTIDVLLKCLPGATLQRIKRYGLPLLEAMKKAEINTPLRQAHFLAQVGHESASLFYVQEIADGKAYEHRADLGNNQPGDGPRFKGRGLIQLTGRANYAAYGAAIGRDLLADPTAVADEPTLAVGVATWFWTRHGLNAHADVDDLLAITRAINGGLNGLDDRATRLKVAKLALGIA